jgi:hypothetical protein
MIASFQILSKSIVPALKPGYSGLLEEHVACIKLKVPSCKELKKKYNTRYF